MKKKKHIYEEGIVRFSHLTFVYGCGIGPNMYGCPSVI